MTTASTDRLHRDALVVDALSAAEMMPLHFDEEILEELRGVAASGVQPHRMLEAAREAFDRRLVAGRLPEYWEWVRASSVDVAHVTVGVDGPTAWSRDNALRDLARWTRLFDCVPGFLKVLTGNDIVEAHEQGRRGIILGFQNCEAIGRDLSQLDLFHQLGIRIIQLTYNVRNLIGDGCLEPAGSGLSAFGRAVVDRMNALGILVDLSHCGERTTLEAIEASDRPVAVTHSFATGLHEHPRGKSDTVLRALAARDGFFGVCAVPYFLSASPSAGVEDFVAHVTHVADVVGVDRVGIGTDQAGLSPQTFPCDLLLPDVSALVRDVGFTDEHAVDILAPLDGYRSWREWPRLTDALLAAGFADDDVRGILGANFLRVFTKATQ